MTCYTPARLFAAVLLLFFSTKILAQIVQSSCEGSQSLQNQYAEDAWYIAYDYQMKSDPQMPKTLPVNPDLKEKVLAALLGVYNADLIARDSVFSMYNIHAYKQIDLRRFEIYVDTTYAWVKNLLAGQPTQTGNYYIDSLAQQYGFSLDFVNYFPAWVDYDALARVRTTAFVNSDFMAKVMLSQTGVLFANPFTFGGDGNQIFYAEQDSFAQLTFRRGWEECPSGCLFQRDWVFKIYEDCRVEFATSYGDHPNSNSPTRTPPFANSTRIFPNPASQQVFIESQNLEGSTATARLADFSGKILSQIEMPVFGGAVRGNLPVELLPVGLYFLTLINENQSFTKKLVVK